MERFNPKAEAELFARMAREKNMPLEDVLDMILPSDAELRMVRAKSKPEEILEFDSVAEGRRQTALEFKRIMGMD
jgi:hypothetical protein